MLKELSQIARGMMFLHGHFTHPEEAADVRATAAKASPAGSIAKPHPRPARRALAAFCAGLPTTGTGLIQIR